MSSSRLDEIRKRLRTEIGEAANHGSAASRDRFSEISSRLRPDISRKSETLDYVDQGVQNNPKIANDKSARFESTSDKVKPQISRSAFCPHCGERLSENASLFCPSCGVPLEGVVGITKAPTESPTGSLKSIHKLFGNKQLIDKDEFSDPGIPQLPARPHCKALCIGMGDYHQYSPLDRARKDACDL